MGELNRYITIQEWMLELGLKPTELMAYAIVYGFSQDGKSMFFGGLDYIMKWCGISRNSACSVMNRLTEKGLIEKVEKKEGAIKFANYRAVLTKIHDTRKLYRSIQKTCIAPIQETCIKKEIRNNKRERKEFPNSIYDLMESYEN